MELSGEEVSDLDSSAEVVAEVRKMRTAVKPLENAAGIPISKMGQPRQGRMTTAELVQTTLDHWKRGWPKLAKDWPEAALMRQAQAQANLAEGEMKDLTMRGLSKAEASSELAKHFLIPLWAYRKRG